MAKSTTYSQLTIRAGASITATAQKRRGGLAGAVGNQAAPYVPSTSFKKYSKSSADADEAEDDAAVLTDSGGTDSGGTKRCKSHSAPSTLYLMHAEQASSSGSGIVVLLLLTVPTLKIKLDLPSPASHSSRRTCSHRKYVGATCHSGKNDMRHSKNCGSTMLCSVEECCQQNMNTDLL